MLIEQNKVVATTSEIVGVTVEEVQGNCRNAELVLARHLAMYVMKSRLNLRIVDIRKYFKVDPATVHHALKKIETYKSMPNFYKKELNYLEQLGL